VPTFRLLVAADLPVVPVAKGGTGQTTANAALNALLPLQSAPLAGYFLQTSGSNTSWQPAAAGQIFHTTSGRWNFNTSLAFPADPGSGSITFDTTTPSTVANLTISTTPAAGVNAAPYLAAAQPGDTVYVQDIANAAVWFRWVLLNAPFNYSTYFTLNVKLEAAGSYGAGGLIPTAGDSLLVEFYLAHSLGNQTAGTVYAGPAPPAPASAPTFRALTTADLPEINQIVGYTYVSADESITGTTYQDLPTPDLVNFTLDRTSNLLIEYSSFSYNNVATAGNGSQVFFDGAAQPTSILGQNMVQGVNGSVAHMLQYKMTGVAAGSHEVRVKHASDTNTSGHWLNRGTKVAIVP
jgi:hypothetical protein